MVQCTSLEMHKTFLHLRISLQEGHTAHETAEEAQIETLQMLEIYRVFQEEYLAIPVIKGIKSESEKIPGLYPHILWKQ